VAANGASANSLQDGPNHFDFDEAAGDNAVAVIDKIIEATRRLKQAAGPPRKRRQRGNGASEATATGYDYPTLGAEVRAHYEDMDDWESNSPLVTKRKGCLPGRFDSFRLRLVERFALEAHAGAGLSLADQAKLFDLLVAWDRTKPGQPVDAGHFLGLRDTFNSATAFITALRDDIDAAVVDEGWLKVDLVEGGEIFQVIFRPVLELALERMRAAKSFKLWSGGYRPAPPTHKRESPMDGDAFRLCEASVINENDENAFVLGLRGFSDASRVSDSGGMFECRGECGAGEGVCASMGLVAAAVGLACTGC